ncbi:hypothetical protein BDW42DRAFT_36827 [Aspergillus taichungensis]|uniref:Uncharacterized protein n=1 Tax=Aspergillus taichungensis TaxID=482145 RepID=A0A2J5HF41_9EURO|nr:hypothetical protein BDW42DRAFT_36827 [Aspergillus taichungensis]
MGDPGDRYVDWMATPPITVVRWIRSLVHKPWNLMAFPHSEFQPLKARHLGCGLGPYFCYLIGPRFVGPTSASHEQVGFGSSHNRVYYFLLRQRDRGRELLPILLQMEWSCLLVSFMTRHRRSPPAGPIIG